MKKTFIKSTELEKVAQEVIKKEKLDNLHRARINYLLVSPNITDTVHGRCIKCSAELAYYSNVDYIIEINEATWNILDDKAKYILMYHELLHINIEYNEKKDEYDFKIKKHDIEDFKDIIDRHGPDWLNFVKQTEEKI